MNGLINVEANSGTFDNLTVNSLNVIVSGTAPTVSPLSNDNNIATTSWVTNHAQVGTYVDLINNQTIVSGIKTFNTLPQSSVVPTLGDEFVNKNFTDATYIDFLSNQNISGEKTFTNANTYINNTLTADTITATGDLTLNPVGSINCNGKTIDMTGGEIHKCPLIHSQNNNNIVVEALGTGDIILKTNGINRVTIADNGVSTFSTLPQCSVVPTLGDEFVNLTALTNATSGSFVDLTTNQTIVSGIKTFNTLPQSSVVATLGDEFVNLTALNSAITTAGTSYAKLASGNAFTSTNTFNSFLPTSTISATTGNEFVNKTTLDNAISTAGGSYVTLAGTQTITGDKTYTGTNDFLSLEASLITNTGSIDTPNIGSGLATDPISIVPSQSSGTCNIATLGTRSGTINIGTGTSGKIMNIGGTATTTNINSLTTTISTSTTTGNGITHSSTATSGDDMRLTATGGYIARLGEGSSSAGLTLLGVDSGTSIIRATTSALQIRADAGITLTGTINANGAFQTTTIGTNVSLFSEASRTGQININIGTSSSATVTIGGALSFNNIVGGTTFTGTTTTTGTSSFSNGFVSNNTSYMNADLYMNQTNYPSVVTTQLGYTITKTFGPANISDTAGTYSNIGSQALGTDKGVYFISCGFSLTASGSDTLNQKAVVLSLTSGTSGTPVNAFGAWEYFDEINDTMGGGGGLRYVGTLCGTYIKTTTSAQTLYLNAYGNTSSTATISCTGNCSITRIG
jgi:hypothetical protein